MHYLATLLSWIIRTLHSILCVVLPECFLPLPGLGDGVQGTVEAHQIWVLERHRERGEKGRLRGGSSARIL
jgi:hypothetical protein